MRRHPPFIAELVDMGLDALNPLEVSRCRSVSVKKEYGSDLVLHGGITQCSGASRRDGRRDAVGAVLKESGGYIFSTDHSVPDSVSLDAFRRIVELAKELGRY